MNPKATAPPISIEAFIGTWSLTRHISLQFGENFSFEGTANIAGNETEVIYHEKGEVQSNRGKPISAERTYIWQPDKDNAIKVLFDDRRYFHSFSASVTRAEHLCSEDLYKVSYNFASWPIWTSVWHVRGPKKHYQMTSLYQR